MYQSCDDGACYSEGSTCMNGYCSCLENYRSEEGSTCKPMGKFKTLGQGVVNSCYAALRATLLHAATGFRLPIFQNEYGRVAIFYLFRYGSILKCFDKRKVKKRSRVACLQHPDLKAVFKEPS